MSKFFMTLDPRSRGSLQMVLCSSLALLTVARVAGGRVEWHGCLSPHSLRSHLWALLKEASSSFIYLRRGLRAGVVPA